MKPLRTNNFMVCIFLGLATISAYWAVSTHQFVTYDDGFYIVNNPNVTAGLSLQGLHWAFTTFHEANWHPLTWLSHQLDASLYGLWAGGHHLTNLFLHTLNTVLLFLLLQRLTTAFWSSAMVAGLFALHPLHVESVAWAAERKDLLCAFFFLITLHFYHHYSINNSTRYYVTALGMFSGALLSKPMAVTLPCLLLLLDIWPLGRIRTVPWRHLVREKIPFLALSAASAVITIIAQKSGGAIISTQQAPIRLRLGNAVVSVMTYLKRTFVPLDLAPLYPFSLQIPTVKIAVSSILLALLLILAIRQFPRRPYLLIGQLWFLGMLVPVSGLLQVGQQRMADRYTYLPLIGVFISLVWLFAELSKSWRHRSAMLGAFSGGVLFLCWLGTSHQVHFWQNSETLFRRALAVTERNYVMHMNLGSELKRQERYAEAITEYLNAVSIQPYNPDTHLYLADGLNAAGKLDEAIMQYKVALQLKPNYLEAHNNLGATYYRAGNLAKAIHHYREALRIDPNDTIAQANLSSTEEELAAKQKTDSAGK